MKLIETRRIEKDKVRAMCIEHNYYTGGTIEDYNKLFEKIGLNYSVLAIATDIFEHSTEAVHKSRLHGYSNTEILENICFNLINDCSYTMVDIEE